MKTKSGIYTLAGVFREKTPAGAAPVEHSDKCVYVCVCVFSSSYIGWTDLRPAMLLAVIVNKQLVPPTDTHSYHELFLRKEGKLLRKTLKILHPPLFHCIFKAKHVSYRS